MRGGDVVRRGEGVVEGRGLSGRMLVILSGPNMCLGRGKVNRGNGAGWGR